MGRARLSITALAIAAVAVWAGPAQAGTPIQIGQVSPVNPGACGIFNFVQTAVGSGSSYTIPSDGVITGWSHRGRDTNPGSGRLQVWRPAGSTNYTLIGRSVLRAFLPGQINSFATSIPVNAGDVLGFRSNETLTGCSFAAGPADTFRYDLVPSDPAPGETRNLSVSTSDKRLNVSATLDPDTSVSLTAQAKKRQRVGGLEISVSGGNEAITGEIGGRAVVKKRAGATAAAKRTKKKIKPKSFSVAAGATETIAVKFKQHGKTVKRLQTLLKRKAVRRKSKATVNVSVNDLAGNSANQTVKIRLKP